MKGFLISDNHDTLVLLKLAGISGVVAHGPAETSKALSSALAMKDLGILLMTELAAESIPEKVREMRSGCSLPLLVEIPDRHGTRRGTDFLTRYIREAIGVKVE
ncbi:MAG: V-type ATP synthase subunit F [Synergistaceae bacterium]|jgi:V/A-type H+-transporting ATPase subunit F|nr:V-type ATP synthase subunit F [Synergistaceae bacterium]